MADNEKIIEFVKTDSSKLEEVQETYPYSFIHIHDENDNGTTDDTLYIGDEKITDRLNVGNENLNSPTRKVGGLDAQTIGELKQKSISQIILDMVRPDVVVPTITTQPSVSISYSGDKLIEVGTNLPNEEDISISVNMGKWSDETVCAGGCTTSLSMSPDKWGEPSEEGSYTITATGVFTSGSKPKDNFGTEYAAYPGGTKRATMTIKSVYPIYINDGQDIHDMQKHIWDYIGGVEKNITVPAEVESPEPMKFKIQVPEQFTTLTVKQFNTLTNQYDIDINMIFVDGDEPYYRRENNSTKTAPVQYKINLKK